MTPKPRGIGIGRWPSPRPAPSVELAGELPLSRLHCDPRPSIDGGARGSVSKAAGMSVLSRMAASYDYEMARNQCSTCGLRGHRHATELDCFDALLLIVKAHRGRIWAGNIAAAVSGLRECIAALEDQSLNRARKGKRA